MMPMMLMQSHQVRNQIVHARTAREQLQRVQDSQPVIQARNRLECCLLGAVLLLQVVCLGHVLRNVRAQSVAAGEALRTDRATERLQPGVDERVCDELLGESKVLVASMAGETSTAAHGSIEGAAT
jgi:hypothetical protein